MLTSSHSSTSVFSYVCKCSSIDISRTSGSSAVGPTFPYSFFSEYYHRQHRRSLHLCRPGRMYFMPPLNTYFWKNSEFTNIYFMKHKVKCRPILSAARGGSPPSPPLATPLITDIIGVGSSRLVGPNQ